MWFNNRKEDVQGQSSYYSIDFDKDGRYINVPYIMANTANQISREQVNNVFLNENDAEEYISMHLDLVELLEKYPVDWNDNNQLKYYFRYEHLFKYVDIGSLFYTQFQGAIYISNKTALESFINKHEKAIKKFIFCIEEVK